MTNCELLRSYVPTMHTPLDREQILNNLSVAARNQLRVLEIHSSLDSTNTYLLQRAREQWPRASACFAEQQTAGRGRQGRTWVTSGFSSLAYSLLWRFHPAQALSGLSLAVGIASAQVLRTLGIADIGLKWPNDLWWHGRKLGGILLESGSSDHDIYVVAGIGINLSLPTSASASIDQPWVDICSIPGRQPCSRNQLAAALLSALLEVFETFEHDGFKQFAPLWAQFDCMRGQSVLLQLPHTSVSGRACGVDEQGALLLADAAGQVRPYIGGEISLRVLP